MIEDSLTGMKVVLLTQPVRAQLHPIQQGWLPDDLQTTPKRMSQLHNFYCQTTFIHVAIDSMAICMNVVWQ